MGQKLHCISYTEARVLCGNMVGSPKELRILIVQIVQSVLKVCMVKVTVRSYYAMHHITMEK